MSVLRSPPNHPPLKYRCLIKISSQIRPAYYSEFQCGGPCQQIEEPLCTPVEDLRQMEQPMTSAPALTVLTEVMEEERPTLIEEQPVEDVPTKVEEQPVELLEMMESEPVVVKEEIESGSANVTDREDGGKGDQESGGMTFSGTPTPPTRRNSRDTSEHGDESHPKKRKRNIMNDKQVKAMETALQQEPEMQRCPKAIQHWTNHLNQIVSFLSI